MPHRNVVFAICVSASFVCWCFASKKACSRPPSRLSPPTFTSSALFGLSRVAPTTTSTTLASRVSSSSSTLLLLAKRQQTAYRVPRWITELVLIVRRHADTEGLFRLSAGSADCERVVRRIERGDWSLDSRAADAPDAHTAANVLKQFLRALPDPLLTAACGDELALACRADSEAERLAGLRDAVAHLPEPNRVLAQRLLGLLSELSESAGNLMTADNLAIVFAPTMLWRASAVGVVDGLERAQESMLQLISNWSRIYRAPTRTGSTGDVKPLATTINKKNTNSNSR
eukprot:TRINITY_DN326_c0_g1_i4.p3 TRINITY_DN326_c0_g1~~TRINITY_DN326_c0_g1_i4.p3  ORF type:complete len:287 (-),score=126.45 TRINITY_DN326_c0_g1_i4:445-1305(-)